MKREMDEQVESQKQYYERLVSDQIKSSLEKDELSQQRLEGVEDDFKEKMTEMKTTFKKEEKNWAKKESVLVNELATARNEIKKLQNAVRALMDKRQEERKNFEYNLAKEKQRAKDESKENVNQIKQLKAYLLREKEAREKSDAMTADVRTELADTQEDLDKMREQLEAMVKSVNEETMKTIEVSKQLEEKAKVHEVLVQKQKLLKTDLEKEKTLVSHILACAQHIPFLGYILFSASCPSTPSKTL